jgi:isopentenyl phosphate kinase
MDDKIWNAIPSNKIWMRKRSDEAREEKPIVKGAGSFGESSKNKYKEDYRKNIDDLVGVHVRSENASSINFEKMF